MKFRNILLMLTAVFICTATLSATTFKHTWVSWSGSDSNPCTETLPCLSFQYALSNTAAGGLITARDAGDFGTVTINQSVTIDGNHLGSITLNSDFTTGITITGGANVTVQNLVINGLGAGHIGINAGSGGVVTVDNCKIMNFTQYGISYAGAGTLNVENSRIETFIGSSASVNGIAILNTAAETVMVKNTVIDASSASNNNIGFNVYPGSGSVMASLQNVTIMGAGQAAVWAETGLTEITGSVLTQSTYGAYAYTGATISVASSQITENAFGVCSKEPLIRP
jgi:hypothetical protein